MRKLFSVTRLFVLLMVLALVGAACDGGEDDTSDPTTTAATATTAAPTEEATTTSQAPEAATTTTQAPAEPVSLTIGLGNMPPSDMPYLGAGSPGQYVWSNIFDGLTVIDQTGAAAPALAESWSVADDNVTWTFNLRSGVSFSNGEPLNAAAVEATFATVLSEDGRATYSANAGNYSFIDSVTAVDDSTVQIVTSAPSVILPAAISIAYILPPAYFADAGAEGFAQAPVGTGPYATSEWSADRIVLEAWDGSWRGAPMVDSLEFLNINNANTRLIALASGDIDIAQSPDPGQAEALESEGFTVVSAPRGAVLALALINNRGGPLADVRVRQALNYAVDTDAIREALTAGFAPTGGVYPPPGINGHDPSREFYPYNPDRARELLADAGYADGFDMTAEVTLGGFPADREIFEAMQGFLADVGVNVELKQIDFSGAWLPNFFGRDGADWEGEAYNLSLRASPLFDAVRPFNFYRCGFVNEFYCDEAASPLIEAVNTTFDSGARNAALKELLDHTAANPPAIILTENFELWALRPGISGFGVFAFNTPFEGVSAGS